MGLILAYFLDEVLFSFKALGLGWSVGAFAIPPLFLWLLGSGEHVVFHGPVIMGLDAHFLSLGSIPGIEVVVLRVSTSGMATLRLTSMFSNLVFVLGKVNPTWSIIVFVEYKTSNCGLGKLSVLDSSVLLLHHLRRLSKSYDIHY